MAPYGGPIWPHMVLYGSVWPLIDPFSPIWSCTILYGPVWSHIVSHGLIWSHMHPYVPVWHRMVHMVSWRQKQNPILNFAVPFLKILILYMLWRAQFLSHFYTVFCVHQILILLPL